MYKRAGESHNETIRMLTFRIKRKDQTTERFFEGGNEDADGLFYLPGFVRKRSPDAGHKGAPVSGSEGVRESRILPQ